MTSSSHLQCFPEASIKPSRTILWGCPCVRCPKVNKLPAVSQNSECLIQKPWKHYVFKSERRVDPCKPRNIHVKTTCWVGILCTLPTLWWRHWLVVPPPPVLPPPPPALILSHPGRGGDLEQPQPLLSCILTSDDVPPGRYNIYPAGPACLV